MKSFDRKFGAGFVSALPAAPGVYRVFDQTGVLVYIGKAKNLRRRLSQYRNAKRSRKHRKMRSIVADAAQIDVILCSSELEACLLEAKLIQENRPKWNVAGAFSFLYPLVGMRKDGQDSAAFSFCYTTQPDQFPEFEFHGAFRSREITREAFFGWVRLLSYTGHRSKSKKPKESRSVKYSYVYSFRQLPASFLESWSGFWNGASRAALEELSLALLDSAAARRDRVEVQEHLRALKRFWRHEAQRLARVRANLGDVQYPVPQAERDLIFLRNKFAAKDRRSASRAD